MCIHANLPFLQIVTDILLIPGVLDGVLKKLKVMV